MKIRKKTNRNTMEYLAVCACQLGVCSCNCSCICACSGEYQPAQKDDASGKNMYTSNAQEHLFYNNNMSSHDAYTYS